MINKRLVIDKRSLLTIDELLYKDLGLDYETPENASTRTKQINLSKVFKDTCKTIDHHIVTAYCMSIKIFSLRKGILC